MFAKTLMKKNGFTMVELLATITIMAVILVIIVPSINRLGKNNQTKGYELYAKSALSAAKFYVEDNMESLTAYPKWKGCVQINYSDLLSADLIKPYSDDRYNCSNLKVQVRKGNTSTLSFSYSIQCLDTKAGNKVVYQKSTLTGGSCSASALS